MKGHIITYDVARKDFEYLETLSELDDWVEIDGRILDLMRNPSKSEAADMYWSCINLWFNEAYSVGRPLTPRAKRIKERYGA